MKILAIGLSPALGLALLFGPMPQASAQATEQCPQLPGDSGLSWNQRGNDDFVICRAVAEDGSEAFGLYLAAESPFEPRRSNREEEGLVAGREVRWYRGEVASDPDKLVRETLLELDEDRVVHIWMHADSEERLGENMRAIEALRFEDTRFSSN